MGLIALLGKTSKKVETYQPNLFPLNEECLYYRISLSNAVTAPGGGMGGVNYPPLLSKHGLDISSKNGLKSAR